MIVICKMQNVNVNCKRTTGFNKVYTNESCWLRPAAEHVEFCSELHWKLWRHFVQGTSAYRYLLLSVFLCIYLRRRRWCFYFGLFVCPSDNLNSCERILTKFIGGVGHGPGTKWLNFGDDPDHHLDPGVRSLKSGFTGLSKMYAVDSDQSCIANLHCKNHSAIVLCCRSARVCALWVFLVINDLDVFGSAVRSVK